MQKDKKELQFSMEDLYNFHLFQDKEPKENSDDDIDDNTFQFSPVTHSRFAETCNEQNDSLTSSPLSDSENDDDTKLEFSFNEEDQKPSSLGKDSLTVNYLSNPFSLLHLILHTPRLFNQIWALHKEQHYPQFKKQMYLHFQICL